MRKKAAVFVAGLLLGLGVAAAAMQQEQERPPVPAGGRWIEIDEDLAVVIGDRPISPSSPVRGVLMVRVDGRWVRLVTVPGGVVPAT